MLSSTGPTFAASTAYASARILGSGITIGDGGRGWAGFAGLLRDSGVKTAVDVRLLPGPAHEVRSITLLHSRGDVTMVPFTLTSGASAGKPPPPVSDRRIAHHAGSRQGLRTRGVRL